MRRSWTTNGVNSKAYRALTLPLDHRVGADQLARHPRWTFHFTPTSASWLNAVEGFFSVLSRRRLRRGTFTGIVDLQAAIKRYIAEYNQRAQPFRWTKPADAILSALKRVPAPSV